jgi:high frequency lysogenization protein
MNKLHKQTLALASLLQSATLVDQLARTGVCDSKSDKASLRSLITNSTNVEEVFNSPKDLSVGLLV